MKYAYQYAVTDGHLIAVVDTLRCLIDTGAPTSVSDTTPFKFAGRSHPVEHSYMGVSCESLSADVGAHIDALVGADILNQYDMLIDPSASTITLSDEPQSLEGETIALDEFMGIPIIQASVADQSIRMFFDTGAKLSYLDPDIIRAFPDAGPEQDFYPGVGKFRTQTFTVPISVGTEEIFLRVGVLPQLLQMTLMMADTSGILGSAILGNHIVCFAPRRQSMILKKWETLSPNQSLHLTAKSGRQVTLMLWVKKAMWISRSNMRILRIINEERGQHMKSDMILLLLFTLAAVCLSACATTSGVMEAEGGTYIISARAAPARGGTAGANAIAYEEAQKFCAAKGARAIVIDARERDVYQSSAGASWSAYGGSAGGGTFAAGNANLRFKCEK